MSVREKIAAAKSRILDAVTRLRDVGLQRAEDLQIPEKIALAKDVIRDGYVALKLIPRTWVQGCVFVAQPPPWYRVIKVRVDASADGVRVLNLTCRPVGPLAGANHDDARVDVTIDVHKLRIDDRRTDPWLLGNEHWGSAGIAVVLLSLPVIVPLAPFLLAANVAQHVFIEQRLGMSRYGWALTRAVKGKIDSDTQALLESTFRKTWRHKRFLQRRVSFAEASEFLAACDSEIVNDDTVPRTLRWKNGEGDIVAETDHVETGYFGRKDVEVIRVLGSTFTGSQAAELRGRTSSRSSREA